MSRLNELINEYCPDGVEYKPVGSFISRERERGKSDLSVQQVYSISNTLGVVRAEEYRENTIFSEDTSGYTILRPHMFAYNPSRLNIGSIAYLKENTPGLVSPMYVVFSVDESVIIVEYLNCLLQSTNVRNKINSLKEEGARFRFDFERWNLIRIPVPPLEIQREIVRILDNFTELTVELTAELTARKKQYEYYRHELLSSKENAKKVPLGELVVSISSGKNKDRIENGNYPVYGSTGIISATEQPKYMHKQILVARVGANAGFVHIAEGKYDVSDNTLIIDVKKEIRLKFLYYLLDDMNLNQYAQGGGQPLITAGQLKKLNVAVPDVKDQDKIISILNHFEVLCSDLTSGLPAEIEARQKQYEYYRDRLLTFKPKETAAN